MTDEQQLRALLMTATEPPDGLVPPVQRLIRAGHRRRTIRTRMRAVTIAAVAAVAVAVPPIVRTLSPSGPPTVTGHGQPGPSAAQIARFRWAMLAPSPLGTRSNPVVVRAGLELIELDGSVKGHTTPSGAAFEPSTGRWHNIAPLPGNVARDYPTTTWTGSQLFFIGQHATCRPTCLRYGALYNPAANRWTTTRLPSAMDGLFRLAAVWTGRDVVLAAADSAHGGLGVASYNAAARQWRMITPRLPTGHPARFVAMVATPSGVILWSLWAREKITANSHHDVVGVDVLALGTDGAWRNITGHWPQKLTVTSPVFTGVAILMSPGQFFCGVACSPRPAIVPGYFANPATLRRTLIPVGPLAESVPPYIWTGRAIIAINLAYNVPRPHPLPLDSIALYDPAANLWTRLPAPPRHPALTAIPVWINSELLALTTSGKLLEFGPSPGGGRPGG